MVRTDKRTLWRGIFFQFWQSVSYIPFYAAVSLLIDKVLNNSALTVDQKLKWTVVYALATLLLWPLHAWFTVKAFAETQLLVRSAVARLRRMVVDQLQRMSMSYFTRKGAGALSNQMTVDLNKVENFLATVTNQIITQVLIGAATLVYLLFKNPWLAGLALLAAPLQITLLRLMGGRVKRASQSLQQSGETFSTRIVEFIAGMRLTKSFGNEMIAAEQLSRDIEDLKERGYETSIVLRWMAMAVQFIWEYTGTLIWCVGGVMYFHGRISLGDLVAFGGLMGFVRQGMMSLFNGYENWSQARPGFEAILELLDSEEMEGFQTVHSRVEIKGNLSLRNVEFRYPRSESKIVLRDLNLEIPSGPTHRFGRRNWRGQEHVSRADHGLLCADRRGNPLRRLATFGNRPSPVAASHRHHESGCLHLEHDGIGKHPLRPARCHRRGSHGRRPQSAGA